jgi:hypothetical protein
MADSDNELNTGIYAWKDLGETATAYTTPAVNERDYANLVANHPDATVYTLANAKRWNGYGFRFVTDDDADAWVIDVFASKGEDYFTRVVTLTLTGGTQVGPATATDADAVFVDTIAKTNEFWLSEADMKVVDGAGADRIASFWFDGSGFDTWAFIATAVEANATLKIQGTGY